MVLEKARELGLALSQSEEFIRMSVAQNAVESDEIVTEALAEFKAKQNELVDLLAEDEADKLQIAALSHDIELLQAQLVENPLFMAVMEAQNAFSALMNMVNQEIGACIGLQTQESSEGCQGSCSGCSGCKH